MRAAVLEVVGEALRIAEVQLRPVGPGEVRVGLAASGVCHSDAAVAGGGIPQPVPAILGHEGAGVVAEVGADVTDVAAGDHVVLSWLAPCRRCFYCENGQVELCERGMDHAFSMDHATWGQEKVGAAFGTATFAEETIVPATAVVRIGPALPLDLAALIGCAVVTGVGAVRNSAAVHAGESIVVVGCGGVGLAAIQGARLAGAAPIIAVDRVPSKLAMAEANGATHTVDAGAGDVATAVKAITGGRGTDHAIEAVGRSATIVDAWASVRRGGTVTVVGAGGFDDPVSFPAMNLMVDAKTIRGCVYGGTDPARDVPAMVELAINGDLDLDLLVTRRIPLDDVNGAFAAMAAGEVARSVIVL